MDRPHLDWQQLSSTEFSYGAAKKEKFTRPTVSQSTGDLYFYSFCPSDESSSSPRHTTSGLWPKKAVFIIRWRRDLNFKTVSWNHVRCRACWSWSPPLAQFQNCLEPVAIIAARLMLFLILSPIPQVNGGEKNALPFCFAFNSGGLHEYCNTDVQQLRLQLS